MARKVLLSFLGTGNYKPCKYVSKELGESKVVEYVQDAICQLACKEFTKTDVIYIFLTKEAEDKHWVKLQNVLKSCNCKVIPIKEMPEGYTEQDIWKIFEKIFEQLQENDEVILDITHGFRSMPMLAMVLLSYAKSLKSISVKAIYYGAFEALGPAFKIDELISNPNDRMAPLLDLKSFSTLQDWTFAAESFIQTGNPKSIVNLTKENIKPILIQTSGKDEIANSINKLVTAIGKGERDIVTNRGKLISESANFISAQQILINLSNTNASIFSPFKLLLKTISNKLKGFGIIGKTNWEASVEWCIEHGLAQQGITQLQEGIIGFVCKQNNLDASNFDHRELASQALNIFCINIDESKWRSPACENLKTVHKIITDPFVIKHNKNFDKLSKLRNDINHGGYKENAQNDSKLFTSKLKVIYQEYKLLSSQN